MATSVNGGKLLSWNGIPVEVWKSSRFIDGNQAKKEYPMSWM
jgi:hypothetical protein